MKLLLSSLVLSTSLFANYAYQNENSGKIDMHGGKGDKLLSKPSTFSKPNVSPLGNISIQKPSSPFAPKALIENKAKKEKAKTKKTTDKNTQKESK